MNTATDILADPAAAWSAWRPTTSDPWNSAKAAHLHRRAGFGATWGQVRRDETEGFEPSLRRVLEGESQGPDGRPAGAFEDLVNAMIGSARRTRAPSIERVTHLWLFRLVFTPHPLAERMTLAWHGHYATSNQKVQDPLAMLEQNLTLRGLWRAKISQLHRAMLLDPALLAWLDGIDSRKSAPNENLAREFLELFALGEGSFAEPDARATARALTGLARHLDEPAGVHIDDDEHDAGEKTLLGQTGPWGVDDVVRIVSSQPAAAVHVARRLYRTLIADTDDPSPAFLEPLAEAMRTNGDVDVARGIEQVLRSRLFFSAWCRGKRVKSPVDYAIGALRACERFNPPPDLVDLDAQLVRMGQQLFYPPGVGGWPVGLDWFRGPTLVARADFAATLAATVPLAPPLRKYHFDGPGAWTDAFATLVLGLSLPPGPADTRPPEIVVRDVLSLPEAQLS